jgi:hypothetical protein
VGLIAVEHRPGVRPGGACGQRPREHEGDQGSDAAPHDGVPSRTPLPFVATKTCPSGAIHRS